MKHFLTHCCHLPAPSTAKTDSVIELYST
uniref:Uncharacterized protein n=1 Tax=Anguilla anguilla TaxID=7936 RepID=A0A0E9SUA1_ANGAN